MAPSTTSPNQPMVGRRESRIAGNGGEATPTTARAGTALALKAKNDAQLATSFRTDLTDIRNLVTCTICDQLLYEPWTLGCGHTYCYSCLCSWFTTNRRKKTCPECRAKVAIVPAPNFLVKQMVDQVFTKRRELMPADESIEQHAKRRAEEIDTVDKDRNGPDGVFKGLFPKPRAELMVDEADGGILRCPGCGAEHIGGPSCTVCGLGVEDPYGLSDMDDEDIDDLEDLDDLEQDLDVEIGAEFDHHHHGQFAHGHFAHAFLDVAARNVGHHYFGHHNHNHNHNHYHHHHPGSQTPSDSEDLSGLDSNSDSEDDDDNSLNDFVVQDDQSLNRPPTGASNSSGPHEAINLVSDDESDEGGAISNRRPRHRVHSNRSPVRLGSMSDRGFTPSESSDIHYGHQYGPGSPARTRSPSALTVTDTDTNISEAGSAELLRQSGWSPLDHGNDSDAEGPISPYGYQHGRYGSLDTDDEDDSENSDTGTETATENGHVDEDDRSREGLSQTPVPSEDRYQSHIQAGTHFYNRNPYEHRDDTDDDSLDHDGDTDMGSSRDSRGGSANPYLNGRSVSRDPDDFGDLTPVARGERGVSVNTTGSSEMGGAYDGMWESDEVVHRRLREQLDELRNGNRGSQNLGYSNDIQHQEAESSDSSIRPPPGRRSRRPQSVARVQQYDPRISMMFAEHQAVAARGSQENPISFDDWEGQEEVRHIEQASRNPARRMTAYRSMDPRQVDPLRSSRSPSSTRVISSSQRNSRLPRQYSRRG
ncbi:hypothetical protein IFR04_001037 [Cadophora malorum]|uniref:RING-type domain-containing protein n=1 Tax=Cadophora malorum TaxID=108018 RepID=A0A8H7WJ81_9HELO|nr:hypothetical protein IFR04_001037 [Cadophora malorum]